ncbi:MAG TPA: membrane protein insertase YidC [Pirellulaceae bacterium]|nr:membrane protein insertase YidC [Pirellulaceae bacterium]
MERRHILFIVLAVLVLATHFALLQWLGPPPKPPLAKKEGDKAVQKDEALDKAGKEVVKDDKAKEGESPQAEVKDPAAKPDPDRVAAQPATKVPQKRVTLGSVDPASGYPGLVTLDSRGAAVERMELAGDAQRRYFDTDDNTGYLGHLGLSADKHGCLVSAVGHGTPAFLAKEVGGKVIEGLKVGDVIVSLNGGRTATPDELHAILLKTKPEQNAEVEVLRPVDGRGQTLTFRTKLTRHPLELIRPETRDNGATTDPLSFLLTLDKVGFQELRSGAKEFSGVSLREGNWELTKSTDDSAEFTALVDASALPGSGVSGSLRIVKRYTLNRAKPGNPGMEHPYSLHLQIEIHNDLSDEVPLAYRLSGPNGLPLEGWWYLTKLHPRIFFSAGARDIVSQQPDERQLLTGCRVLYDNYLKAKKDKQSYEGEPLLSGDKRELNYVGVDTQFFAAMIIPRPMGDERITFRKAFAEPVHDVSQLKSEYSRTANNSVVLVNDPVKVAPGGVLKHDYEVFLGPKDDGVLTAYQLGSLIEKGWRIFAVPTNILSWVLHKIYDVTGNYGIAIVLLTVIVRACMLPLSIKQAKNAAKMQELAPEIKKIKEKYAGDTEKQMKAQQELYKKHNFNMFGGCLPVFVQLPIFIGLYRCLSVDIALRDASLIPGFWWASNLAGPDQLFFWKEWMPAMLAGEAGYLGPFFNILPVVTCVLFIVQQQLFMPPATDEQSRMQQSMMKYMTIFMGIMFFKVPAGLCIYFIISTSWSIIERTFLPKHKPPAGGAETEAKPVATKPSPNGSPADKRGPKVKRK